MADKKTIVLVGASQRSWEEALRNIVRKAADSVHNIDDVCVLHQSAKVDEAGEIVEFRTTAQIAFEIERETTPD